MDTAQSQWRQCDRCQTIMAIGKGLYTLLPATVIDRVRSKNKVFQFINKEETHIILCNNCYYTFETELNHFTVN